MNAEISLGIGGSIADAKFKFDSGFPGLRLTMDKEIKAGVDFRYDLTFGLSRSRGFYVRTDEPADTHRDKELSAARTLPGFRSSRPTSRAARPTQTARRSSRSPTSPPPTHRTRPTWP